MRLVKIVNISRLRLTSEYIHTPSFAGNAICEIFPSPHCDFHEYITRFGFGNCGHIYFVTA